MKTPLEVMNDSRSARQQGKEWLTAGLGVGAIGVLGALAGAVCPVCVVATPALVGAGLARLGWAKHLQHRAQAALEPTAPPSPSTEPQ